MSEFEQPDEPLARKSADGPDDDAIIGRALRVSVTVFALLAVVTGVIVIAGRGRRPGSSGPLTTLHGPQRPETRQLAGPPATPFVDVTSEAGVRFLHVSGARGEKLLPETMGSGVAFFDFDRDGDPDLLFVNGTEWKWNATTGDASSGPVLLRNDGGRFLDVSEAAGFTRGVQGMGVACGDFDGDGQVDLFVSGVADQRLYRNVGEGRFRDVTRDAGLEAGPDEWGTSSAFLDYDNDGDLDLFVCQYLRWSRELDLDVDYRLVGVGRAYGPPVNFPGAFPKLYRNEGGRKFTDVSAAAGLHVRNRATGQPMAKSLGVAPVDIDGDGWMDLMIANDTVQNFVFLNRRDGTFSEVGFESGFAFDTFGAARGAMGIDAGRFTEDESIGVSIGNFANEMLALYVRQPDKLLFADEAIAQGVGAASRLFLTFGVFFFDADLDGWLDLLTANGHIEADIAKVQASQQYRQSPQLYWNTRGVHPGGGFVPVGPESAGPGLSQMLVARGSAYADIDGDGDLDVVLTQNGAAAVLLRNDQSAGNQWLRLQLEGERSNRDAIGAWVRLRSGPHTWWRQVMPTRGYLSQSELPVTFGLGRGGRIDEVEIQWPSGRRQRLAPQRLRLNAMNRIRESDPEPF